MVYGEAGVLALGDDTSEWGHAWQHNVLWIIVLVDAVDEIESIKR